VIGEAVPFFDSEAIRQILILGGGLTAVFGYGQLLWYRQRQAVNEARALRHATGEDRQAAEREAEQARIERRAAEHERRNAENVAQLSGMQLAETERQLVLCRESEQRLRADVNAYRTDLDFKGEEIKELRAQVVELRRILRVRFADEPRRHSDPPDLQPDRET
jgi:hypothetical protein